jgi:type III pantothenate kinase
MNLVIDQGNSFTKVAIFESHTLIKKESFESAPELVKFLDGLKVEFAMISTVKGSASKISWPFSAMRLFSLDATLPLPIKNLYATPLTLGYDRIAAACGAHLLYPSSDCLVVDAGTCINYEFVNKKGEYLGGAISPGLKMRFEAMHERTAQLPVGTLTADAPLIGDNTMRCLQSGVMNGAIEEVRGIIARYVSTYPGLRVILSGGDANVFENHLNPSIFVAPEVVLMGLNSILLHNVAS